MKFDRPQENAKVLCSNSTSSTPARRGTGRVLAFSLIAIVILAVVAAFAVYINYRLSVRSQNAALAAAHNKCQKEPVVILKYRSYLFGGSTTYELVTPLNPSYQNDKNLVSSPLDYFGTASVHGYYCSVAEAKSTDPGLLDDTENYTVEENQQVKETYLLSQKNKGEKFYAPTQALKRFKVSSKRIVPESKSYVIEYQRIHPTADELGELITLICEPSDAFANPSTYVQGKIVGKNSYGGNIALDSDIQEATSVLPTAICNLRYEDYLNDSDAVAHISSLSEVEYSVIAAYDLGLLHVLPN